jgi:AcrR family transcriptional regulator
MPDRASPGRVQRADARRNREHLLLAARDLFIERGPDAPLEAIAQQANVGIATLYRHFPDRVTLMRSVVQEALTQTTIAAENALADTTDGLAALRRYMHAVVDLRVSAVIPALLDHIRPGGRDLPGAPDAAPAVQQIIAAAHAEGSLDADVSFGDIAIMLVRLSRPLPGGVPPAVQLQLAHRHVDLLIDGLRAQGRSASSTKGPGLSLAELQALRDDDG